MQDIEEIYNKYSKMLYKYIFCLSGNAEISEEIVQDTFLVAVKDINKFEGKCKISTWLCSIAKNLFYQKLRKDKSKNNISIDEVSNSLILEESIEENLCDKETKIEVLKKVQTLDEDTRNVIYLRTFGNLNYEEIAEIMNKTSSWARVTYFRGKQKLREMKD